MARTAVAAAQGGGQGGSQGGKSQSDMKRQRQAACESCYASRVKCVYKEPSEGNKCERCLKQNRKCVKRIVMRGKSGEAVSNQGITKDVDVNAFKALGIAGDTLHLTQHYNGAAAFIKTYKALGYTAPPPSLRNFLNMLYLVSTKEKSIGRLHAVTTLAMSAGIEIDITLLSSRDFLPTAEEKTRFRQMLFKIFFEDRKSGPCFIILQEGGDRSVQCSSDYELLFKTADEIKNKDLTREDPHLESWRDFVVEQRKADLFMARVLQAMIKAEKNPALPACYKWSVTSEGPVDIKDRDGNPYTCILCSTGWMGKHGAHNCSVLGFKDLKPMNAAARERYNESVHRARAVSLALSSAPGSVPGMVSAAPASAPAASSESSNGQQTGNATGLGLPGPVQAAGSSAGSAAGSTAGQTNATDGASSAQQPSTTSTGAAAQAGGGQGASTSGQSPPGTGAPGQNGGASGMPGAGPQANGVHTGQGAQQQQQQQQAGMSNHMMHNQMMQQHRMMHGHMPGLIPGMSGQMHTLQGQMQGQMALGGVVPPPGVLVPSMSYGQLPEGMAASPMFLQQQWNLRHGNPGMNQQFSATATAGTNGGQPSGAADGLYNGWASTASDQSNNRARQG